jgi:hypothetical protein
MSRSLADLKEPFRTKAAAFLDDLNSDPRLKALGVACFLTVETLRDLDVQLAYGSRLLAKYAAVEYPIMAVEFVQKMYKRVGLYDIGSKEALTPNTWTLKSKHLEGLAIDVAPSCDGKTFWWAPPSWPGWDIMGEIAVRHSIEPGSQWKGNKDCPHFQERAA